MKNQRAIVIAGPEMDGLWDREFSGTSTRPSANTVPLTGFTSAKEIRFFPWGFKTRQGYGIAISDPLGPGVHSIRQCLAYTTNDPLTGAIKTGTLFVEGSSVYDSASPTPTVSIYSLASSGNYISIITVFGRIYLTEHDCNLGRANSSYKYYPGTGVAAVPMGGGNVALGAANFASSGTAGNVTQGLHVFGVAIETDSGYIGFLSTTPGINVAAYNIANTNQQVTATNIPLGPAGTTKRHILASRVITGYSGNPTDYAIFFVAEIPDNVTTTLTFNFTDESLRDSADYLYSELAGTPGCLGFCWYSNRLITFGEPYFGGDNVGPSVLRASQPGNPETTLGTEDTLEVFKDDGQYGVKNCFEQDGLLVICKESKTYVTRDNGGPFNTWQVSAIDNTVGTTVFGVTKALDSTGAAKSGKTVMISKSGVYLFQGQVQEKPLTWKIERRWQQIAGSFGFNTFQVIDIASAKMLLFLVDDGTFANTATFFLAADYSLGLDWKSIRWSEWHPAGGDSQFMTLKDSNTLQFVMGDKNIYRFILGTNNDYTFTRDFTSVISGCEVITSELKWDAELNRYQVAGMRMRGIAIKSGDETDLVFFMGDDSFVTGQVNGLPNPPWTPYEVGQTPTPEILKSIINFSGYYLRAKFTWRDQNFEVRHLIFFGNVTAEDKGTFGVFV